MDRQLIDYLPEVMKGFDEFKELMKVEQPEVEALFTAMDNLLKEGFVQDETDQGAERWESILEITPKDTDSLEIRNLRISGRLNEDLPYTYRTLERQLEALCGEEGCYIELKKDDYILKIRVSLEVKGLKQEIEALADRIVPANLILDVELMYNTHGLLGEFSHKRLHTYTHKQLRESVLRA